MDQKSCTTIVSPDPRKSLSSRESHPGVIPDYPGLSRIKTFDRAQRVMFRALRSVVQHGGDHAHPRRILAICLDRQQLPMSRAADKADRAP